MSKGEEERDRIVTSLRRRDTGKILIIDSHLTEEYVDDVVACIDPERADEFYAIEITNSHLSDDKGGLLIAEILKRSKNIFCLSLIGNSKITMRTINAVARALTVNTSLTTLIIINSAESVVPAIHAAMLWALRLNPNRSDCSHWYFGDKTIKAASNAFHDMKAKIDRAGHPTLLALLAHHDPPPLRLPNLHALTLDSQ